VNAFLLRLVACLFVVSSSSHAALYDRGNGLIYDDILDITWLQDANYAQTSGYDADGIMIWADANAWADQLNYDGYNDWRLPSANLMGAANPCFAHDGSCDSGYNNTTSELGHMFFNNLGNTSDTQTLENVSFIDATLGGGTESFLNVQSSGYWLSEEYAPVTGRAWGFTFTDGFQNHDDQNNGAYNWHTGTYSWAVRDGDVSTVPISAKRLALKSLIQVLGHRTIFGGH